MQVEAKAVPGASGGTMLKRKGMKVPESTKLKRMNQNKEVHNSLTKRC